MAFAFPAGEAITRSHSPREPKIDDLGVWLVSVSYFILSLLVFQLPLYPAWQKNFLSSQGEDSSITALEPSL